MLNCEIHCQGHRVEVEAFLEGGGGVNMAVYWTCIFTSGNQCHPLTILTSFCKLIGKLFFGNIELNMCFNLENLL